MPVERLPLLRLGGEGAFTAYQAEFDRLYVAGPVEDLLGRRVEFLPSACRHVCFKTAGADPYGRLPRGVWAQERAERIPWILTALTEPEEIRPSHQTEGHQVYLLLVSVDPILGHAWERFGVYVEPAGTKRVIFVTAFPMDAWYWKDARLYPAPKRKRR